MTEREAITQEYLRSILDYDPETGLWRWHQAKGRRAKGWFVGSCDGQGYPTIGIRAPDGSDTVYKAHRLAFLYMEGKWPTSYVDHRNQIKTDNRWSNLREATRSQNGGQPHKVEKLQRLQGRLFPEGNQIQALAVRHSGERQDDLARRICFTGRSR